MASLIHCGILVSFLFLAANSYPIVLNNNQDPDTVMINSKYRVDLTNEHSYLQKLLKKNPELFEKLIDKDLTHLINLNELDSAAEAELKAINSSPDENESNEKYSRQRRRISVLKNVYQQCRVQKRKGKDLCLYLANLYQNVKGFHGL